MDKATPSFLRKLPYPECCQHCYTFEHFGSSECRDLCSEKFDEKESTNDQS